MAIFSQVEKGASEELIRHDMAGGVPVIDSVLRDQDVAITNRQNDSHLAPPVRTLFVHIPISYNADADGKRLPVEPEKLRQTEDEIRHRFPGYSWSRVTGWWRDEATGEEFDDETYRYEVDAPFDTRQLDELRCWKQELEIRFRQRAIYFKFSAPIVVW